MNIYFHLFSSVYRFVDAVSLLWDWFHILVLRAALYFLQNLSYFLCDEKVIKTMSEIMDCSFCKSKKLENDEFLKIVAFRENDTC